MPYTDQGLPHAGSAEVLYSGLFEEPAGTLACGIRGRQMAQNLAPVTGNVYVFGIPLPAGLPVTSLGIFTGTTAEITPSHGWHALLDPGSNVLAVTADQGSNVVYTASAMVKLPVTVPIVIPQTGLYYFAFSISAATMPTIAGVSSSVAGLMAVPPVRAGTAGNQAATPAIGAQLAAIVNTNALMYGCWIF